MNEVIEKETIKVENMIYEIRGVQVMTAYDLAKLYQCKNGTKEINQAVKNNPNKFPTRFSWILTNEEAKTFLVNNFDQKIETRGGRLNNTRVFTEQGIAMLATILKTKIATEVSIRIMDAFVKMRHYITDSNSLYKSLSNINNKLIEHDEKLDYLFSKFDKKEQLFKTNTEYDAFSCFVSIFKESKKELIIVDPYADITILDITRKLNCNVILITKNSDRISNLEIEKYNKQYHNLTVIRNNDFHDRYFVIDQKKIYHSGTSINNAGEKVFSINRLEDKFVQKDIINEINLIMKKEAI